MGTERKYLSVLQTGRVIAKGFSVPQRVEHDVLGHFDRTDLVKSDRLKTATSGGS